MLSIFAERTMSQPSWIRCKAKKKENLWRKKTIVVATNVCTILQCFCCVFESCFVVKFHATKKSIDFIVATAVAAATSVAVLPFLMLLLLIFHVIFPYLQSVRLFSSASTIVPYANGKKESLSL